MATLHLIAGPDYSQERITEVINEALPWVDWIHLRMKGFTEKEVYQQAERLLEVGDLPLEKLIINEYVDVALSLECAGVHLPEQAVLSPRVRSLLSDKNMLLGRSVHSVLAAGQGAMEGADYLFFGHIFPSNSKPGLPPRGLKQLKKIVQAVDIPVFAIGGITLERIQDVKDTGCAGVAVISAIFNQPCPGLMAQALKQSWAGSQRMKEERCRG